MSLVNSLMVDYQPKYNVEAKDVHGELSKHMLADGFDFVLDLNQSNGSHFIDKVSGKNYLDFFSFFAAMPIGINHPKMNNESFINYIGKIALNKPSNSDVYTEQMAAFVKTFFKVAVPDYFKYIFMIDGGALAVENALKTAFDWKVRKNFKKGYSSERGHKIIHFHQAFHGRSGYTMSLTNTDPAKIQLYPKFDWPRITNPKLEFPLNEERINNTIALEKQAIEEIKSAFMNNKDDIAAIIIEPIQCEGGDIHFRSEFLQELRNFADDNEALLIFDEVQTGLGMTGKMWCHQHHDVKPDILVFGKKVQTCGILVSDRIDDIPENVFHTSSRINSTWGSNLVDMVRSTKYLEIIEEDDLVGNAQRMGDYLKDKINGLYEKYPNLVGNPRGRGLLRAFSMPTAELRNQFRNECYSRGFIILGCGDRSIRFRPALDVTTNTIDLGINLIENIFNNMKQ